MMATARNLGMVLGVGLAGAMLTTILARSRASPPAAALINAVNISLLVMTGAAALGVLTCALGGGEDRSQEAERWND
jgi:hypothetical protein